MKKFFCYVLPFLLGIVLMVACIVAGDTSADQPFKAYRSLSPEEMYKALKNAPEVEVELISTEWIDGERIQTTQTFDRDGELAMLEWETRNLENNKVVNDGREYQDFSAQMLYAKRDGEWTFQRGYQASWEQLLEDIFPQPEGFQVFFEDDNYYGEDFSEDENSYFLTDKATNHFSEKYGGDYTDENGDPCELQMRMYRTDTVYQYFLVAADSASEDAPRKEIKISFAEQTVTLPKPVREILHPSTPSAFYEALRNDDALSITLYESSGAESPYSMKVNYAGDLLEVTKQQSSSAQTTWYDLENQIRYQDGNETELEDWLDWDVFADLLNEHTGGLLGLNDKLYQYDEDNSRYVMKEASAEEYDVRMATYSIVSSTDSFLYSITYLDGRTITIDYCPNVSPTIELP